MFNYGRAYSKLSLRQLKALNLAGNINDNLISLSRLYFWLFGYPDVASQKRYLIVEQLLKPKKGEKILDAGCGNGIYLQEFGDKFGTRGYGVDARINRIQAAKQINTGLGRNDIFKTSTLEKLDLGREKFDKAICLEVLEHIVDDRTVVKNLAKHLIKNGIFVISVPIKGTALSKEQEQNPNFKPKKWEHVRSGYEVEDLKNMAKAANLKVVSINKYFFLISRYMVKFQQFLFKKKLIILNLMLSPLLLLVSSLDNVFRIYPRGYMIVLKKK